jgi:hypothetical protein
MEFFWVDFSNVIRLERIRGAVIGFFEMEKLRITGFGPAIFLISFLVGHQ